MMVAKLRCDQAQRPRSSGVAQPGRGLSLGIQRGYEERSSIEHDSRRNQPCLIAVDGRDEGEDRCESKILGQIAKPFLPVLPNIAVMKPSRKLKPFDQLKIP